VEKESQEAQIPTGVVPKKRKSSKAWVWAILFLVVICGLALGGYFLWGKGSKNTSTILESKSENPIVLEKKSENPIVPEKKEENPIVPESKSEEGSLYPVMVNGKWGYIDKTGKIVIDPQFDGAYNFSEGLAAVKVGDKWGYIDKTGKIVIDPQFYWADSFSEGLALVRVGEIKPGKWGYIDNTGRYVWEPTN